MTIVSALRHLRHHAGIRTVIQRRFDEEDAIWWRMEHRWKMRLLKAYPSMSLRQLAQEFRAELEVFRGLRSRSREESAMSALRVYLQEVLPERMRSEASKRGRITGPAAQHARRFNLRELKRGV